MTLVAASWAIPSALRQASDAVSTSGNSPWRTNENCAGCLIVAHTGFGSIWRLSPVGEPILRVKSPAGISTTNIAYGGPDHATLFITDVASGVTKTVTSVINIQ